MNQQTVLEFLEETKELPRIISVERSTISKYQFYLIVRHYRKRLGRRPQFIQYEKKTADSSKSLMEEYSIFDEDPLYVLEGFSQNFIDGLMLPEHSYLVAEADEGMLKAEPYSYRQKRSILKILLHQLNLKLGLRNLLSFDWNSLSSYEDYETLLRKAKIMEWTEEQIGEQLKEQETGQILTLLKRSQFKEIYNMIQKYGPIWTHDHLCRVLVQLIHYRALKGMGYEDDRISKELEIGYARSKELIDSATMLTNADIKMLVHRLIKQDRLLKHNTRLGLDLFLLNSPIKIRK